MNAELFWNRVDKTDECWLWTGGLTNGGYGKYTTSVLAHRTVYEWVVGPIGPGLVLDHLCRVRNCVNPDHLEPVTAGENIRRGNSGRNNSDKTHCPHGHAYEANTYFAKDGSRECKTCKKAAAKAYYHRKKK